VREPLRSRWRSVIAANSLFYRSLHGARVGDIYMALIYTAELHDENPFETSARCSSSQLTLPPTRQRGCRGRFALRSLARRPQPRKQRLDASPRGSGARDQCARDQPARRSRQATRRAPSCGSVTVARSDT